MKVGLCVISRTCPETSTLVYEHVQISVWWQKKKKKKKGVALKRKQWTPSQRVERLGCVLPLFLIPPPSCFIHTLSRFVPRCHITWWENWHWTDRKRILYCMHFIRGYSVQRMFNPNINQTWHCCLFLQTVTFKPGRRIHTGGKNKTKNKRIIMFSLSTKRF